MRNLTITIDTSELQESVAEIMRLLEPGLSERVPQGFRDSLLALIDSGLLDCIVAGGITAPGTGDHIIRLGIAGKLKELTSAARAFNLDVVGYHD